ncbi:MAG: peptide chain release factor 2 [Candidatus Moranbacteria bacterium]|nr:peptide chain release factor 2 [Candidatus Moranbacteria bacterium]
MAELQEKLNSLKEKIAFVSGYLDLPSKKKRIEELEKISATPDFWKDNLKASQAMQELEELRKELLELSEAETEISELLELAKIISAGDKEEKELEEKIKKLEKDINELEFKTLFSGKYDRSDAIVSIYSGAGGVDAQDWAEMLLRMYLKWAEKNNFKARIVDEARGQEAGIKNATIEISGLYAYGNLRSENGVHRLVRLSPYNADNLRQTSFALADVMPVIEEMKEVIIDPKDIRIDVYRSSGAGGQGVNTTDSAVRITHLPTGIMATCQNERSQLQNKEEAMKILKAKLHKKYLEEKEQEKSAIRGEAKSAEWGSQIRSYVLHPYKMVKDHRTKYETSDPEAVLGGDISGFIEAYLKLATK